MNPRLNPTFLILQNGGGIGLSIRRKKTDKGIRALARQRASGHQMSTRLFGSLDPPNVFSS